MKKISIVSKLMLLALFTSCLSIVNADDLVFDSFEEAQKAAEKRGAEYDRRMAEHNSSIHGAWEKQKNDLGDNATCDISKITETRTTEQTSENAENKKVQDSVTNSINDLKQQMINTAGANTVGFAGASAAYRWSVEYKDGKYVLSDTYDEAMFVSGASGNKTVKTASGEKSASESDSGNKSNTSDTNNTNETNNTKPDDNVPEEETPSTVSSQDNSPTVAEPETVADEPESEVISSNTPNDDAPATIAKVELAKADRVVEVMVQHPTTFEEAIFSVTEGTEPKVLRLDKFSIPEDTRVKISAKANMEIDNSPITMTIIDDEGEGEPIDSSSMKNYRHLFRIPSQDEYSVNIYVNEAGKKPKKIMQLCLPVVAVDFDSRTISR